MTSGFHHEATKITKNDRFHHRDTEVTEERSESHSRQPRMRFDSAVAVAVLSVFCVSVVIAGIVLSSPSFASLTVVNMGASNVTAPAA